VNRTLAGSQPDWAVIEAIRAPEGAPNVLLVLIDDAGFGNPSAFGGPVDTPNLARVADEGLRYNTFHVTALCSPTRAALLSGRNHHAVGFGSIGEMSTGFPGYTAFLPKDCAPFTRVLQGNGYSTGGFGKWHLTPDHQQGAAGPFDRWPSGWGFDYFWGFLGGEAGQYDPVIVEDDHTLGVPEGKDGKPYYLPDVMADRTIEWLHAVRAQDSDKPWFVYFSTGASHAPHHVPPEWSARYKGRFDAGWDRYREETFERQKRLGVVPPNAQLTPRDQAFPAWDSIPAEQRPFFARQMEVYAGYQENADWNLGRLLDAIEEMGETDNTLVIWIWGDNGASMEGTLTGTFNELTMHNGIPLTPEQQLALAQQYGGLEAWGTDVMAPHYAAAWALAGNTPFQWGKQVASHLGGTRNPMAVRWPKGVQARGVRSQFTHVIDVGPTILEAAGLPQPNPVDGIDQKPMQGTSFAYTFTDAAAPERHTQQYFEIFGNRAIYKDGWWLAMKVPRVPWDITPDTLRRFAPGVWDPDADPAELYYLPDDFSQARDLAGEQPARVEELKRLFWEEAEKNNVMPLMGGFSSAFGIVPPLAVHPRSTYYGDVENVAPGMIPRIYNHSYTVTADLEVPAAGAEGTIVAEADHLGGFSLFVRNGRLQHTYSMVGVFGYHQEASEPLPAGVVRVRLEFAADAPAPGTGGQVTLFVNDRAVGGGRIDHTVPFRFSGYAGMDIGRDNGLVVDRTYAAQAPFAFTGVIRKVVFDVNPHLTPEAEQALHELSQRQLVAHGLSG
jgi:arylsulfatase